MVKWIISRLVIAIKFSDQDQIWCKHIKVCFGDVLRDRKFEQYQGPMIALYQNFPFTLDTVHVKKCSFMCD